MNRLPGLVIPLLRWYCGHLVESVRGALKPSGLAAQLRDLPG
jgi:hypothetical protein